MRKVGRNNLFYGKALIAALVARAVAKEAAKQKSPSPTINGEDAVLLSGESTPGLERLRLAKATLAELDVMERHRKLLPREDLQQWLMQLASTLRAAGETLQRQFGPDALRIHDEALDEFDRQVKEKLGSNPLANGTH